MENMFHFRESVFRRFAFGDFFRASQRNFPVLKGLAVQGLVLAPGGIREPHTHPNAHQLDYCIKGDARVGIVGPNEEVQLLDLHEGDISFVPQGYLHWIENTGQTEMSFLVVLSHEEPQTVELSEMLSGVPRETLAKMYGVSGKVFEAIPSGVVVIGGTSSGAHKKMVAAGAE
jgi:oxalate decarboxylase/phosphoglucose isomerase-like protein (cupin superfamily)